MTLLCFSGSAGSYTATEVQTVTECLGFIAVQASDHVNLSMLGDLFNQYFAFNESLFEFLVGTCLLTFVSGHVLGRIMQGMRKAS